MGYRLSLTDHMRTRGHIYHVSCCPGMACSVVRSVEINARHARLPLGNDAEGFMQHVYGLGLPTGVQRGLVLVAAIIASYVPTEANKPDSGVWGRSPSTGVGNLQISICFLPWAWYVICWHSFSSNATCPRTIHFSYAFLFGGTAYIAVLRALSSSARVPGLCTTGAVVRRHSLAASVGLVIVSTLCLRLIGCHRPQRRLPSFSATMCRSAAHSATMAGFAPWRAVCWSARL
jgi:hypothetical protein